MNDRIVVAKFGGDALSSYKDQPDVLQVRLHQFGKPEDPIRVSMRGLQLPTQRRSQRGHEHQQSQHRSAGEGTDQEAGRGYTQIEVRTRSEHGSPWRFARKHTLFHTQIRL